MAQSNRFTDRTAVKQTAFVGSCLLTFFALTVGVTSCKTAPKKTTPELAKLAGKKVALVSVEAEDSARSMIEVALVNQLISRGTFILISQQDVETARVDFRQDPTNWRALARRAGADVALRAHVIALDATTRTGYDTEVIKDSQWEEETGEATRKKTYKVKSLTGHVEIRLDFTDLSNDDNRTGVATADEVVKAEEKNSPAVLPMKLSFLEKLTNAAFKKFFLDYD